MGLGHAVSEKTISVCSGEMQSVPKSLGTRAPPGGRTEPDLEVVPALLLRPHPQQGHPEYRTQGGGRVEPVLGKGGEVSRKTGVT